MMNSYNSWCLIFWILFDLLIIFSIQVQLKKIEPREREFEQEQGPILITLLKPQAIREGDSATFSTQYSASPAPEVKWYREGREIEGSDDFQVLTKYIRKRAA